MSRLVGMGLLSFLLSACQALPAGPAGRGAQPPAAAAPTTVAEPAATAPAGPLQVVRVGGVGTASEATYYWAQERGYLREEGLELEFEIFSGAQQMIPPLGTGQLDVGSGAPGPGLFNAILRGVNVRIVADRARAAPGTSTYCLVVRKSLLDSGSVRSFADLRGRVLAENVAGAITTSIIDRELQRVGLSLKDVTISVLPFPDMVTGFKNGVVDFGVLIEPFMTLGEEQGVLRCWKPISELSPNFQIAVLLYSPVFIEQHADAARRFMVAHLRAMRDYYRAFFGDGQGRDEFLQLMARVSAAQDVGLLARLNPTWSDPNGTVNIDSLRDVQHWYLSRGEQISEVDFDIVIDMRFVDYALNRLGRYPIP